jgi:prophage antirepressor-like protein
LLRQAWTADGEPLFVAKDVCAALGIKNHLDALKKGIPEDEQGVVNVYPIRNGKLCAGAQPTRVLTEPGLYRLIMRSDKPEAAAVNWLW